jgi:hypothetical protein
MNRHLLIGLIAGIAIGSGSTAAIFLSRRAAPDAPRPKPLSVADRKSEEPVKPAPTTSPSTSPVEPAKEPEKKPDPVVPAPPKVDLKEAFAKLAEKGLAGYMSKEFNELVSAMKAAGKEGLEMAIEKLLKSESAEERFMAAALLESLHDPAAIPALHEALGKDGDELVRRMASHALAVIGTEAAQAGLRKGMEDEDWGVRVNSAYGLAKQKDAAGLDYLTQAYASDTTPAEYRLAILGGLADVAAPENAPIFRKILSDTTDMSYLLISIGALEKMKDTAAIPDLQKLAQTSKNASVRQAAQRAIDAIAK